MTKRIQACAPAHRVRRTLLILGACWLVLSTAWVARRWRAVRILEASDAAREVSAVWQSPAWLGKSAWRKLWPASRIKVLYTDGRIADGKSVGWAVRVCGVQEYLQVSKTSGPSQVRLFLLSLGPQPFLENISLANVPLDEHEIATLLRGCPRLRHLTLHNVPFSGADFPELPLLERAGFRSIPLSDAGLAALLRGPALRTFDLRKTAVTAQGVRQIPQGKPKTLEDFVIEAPGLTQAEIEEFQAMIQTHFPSGKTLILSKFPEYQF
jgi:hypothetical protein